MHSYIYSYNLGGRVDGGDGGGGVSSDGGGCGGGDGGACGGGSGDGLVSVRASRPFQWYQTSILDEN